jgi:hypothetical protein
MRLFILLFCSAIFVVACSPDSDSTPKIAEGQRKVLDKAKTVDTTQQKNTEAEKEEINKQAE